ncbi:MAG: response regulator [Parabacteroides sp.]
MFPTRLSYIKEDNRGYIWIATRSGLGRYDGSMLKKYMHDPEDPTTIPGSDVYCVEEDPDQQLWVFTVGGVAIYDYNEDSFRPVTHPDGHPIHAYAGCAWKEGMLIVSGKNVYYYNNREERLTQIAEMPNEYWFERVRLLDDNTLLCLGRSFRIIRVKLDTGESDSETYKFGGAASDVWIDSNRNVWVSTLKTGLHCFTSEGKLIANYTAENSQLPTNRLSALTESKGKIVIGTMSEGLLMLDPTNGEVNQFKHTQGEGQFTIPGNIVNKLYTDKYDNVLMGVSNHGLVVFSDVYLRTYGEEGSGFGKGPTSNTVLCIHPMGDKIWLGASNSGLNCFYPKENRFVDIPNTRDLQITAIEDINEHQLLLSAYGKGMILFDTRTHQRTPILIMDEQTNAQCIGLGNDIPVWKNTPETMVMLTNQVFIYHFKENRFSLADWYPSHDSVWMSAGTVRMISSHKDFSYISDRKKVFKLDHQKEQVSLVYQHAIGDEVIHTATESTDGYIWLGTSGGLRRLDPKTKEVKRIETSLFTDALSVKADPGVGRIWIGTYYGLYSYNPHNDQFVAYNKMDGAANMEFVRTSVAIDGDYLYMGGVKGLLQIEYDKAVRPNTESIYEISECLLNGQSIGNPFYESTTKLKIPHRSNLFLRVLTQNKERFRKRAYRFLVTNYSKEPILEPSSELQLYNLHAGHYDIKVSVTMNNGMWSEFFPLGSFVVLQPWYLQGWFILTVTLIVLFIIGGITSYFMLRKKQQYQQELARNKLHLNEEKIDFLVNVSHELRTPLTLIYAPLNRLLSQTKPSDPNYRLLQTACRQSSRMTDIINMVLDLEKMERKAVKIHIQPHPLNKWIEEGIHDFVLEGEERQVKVVFEPDKRIDKIPFDISKCDIVLNNLVMNALKHSPEGTTLTVKSLLVKEEGIVRVEISDQGSGLQPGDEKELFTRFYQGAKESSGTGLGLAYSKVLLEQHKGSIGAYNNPDKGATFFFTLPLKQEQMSEESEVAVMRSIRKPAVSAVDAGSEPATAVTNQTPATEKYDYTLLVVDDQESITQFLQDALKDTFKQVLTAKDGVDALKVLKNNRPDAVVSDVMMPRMDGFELCKQIKSDLTVSHIPVTLLTAKTDEHSILAGYKTGADAYLPKPFDVEVLKQIVLNQLNTHQRVQDKYSTPGVVPLPEEVTISYADEAFLKKLNQLVEDNISNVGLDIALLEKEMCMSRASLFNKMKALTGMGCNEYITKIRMERAIHLVKESALTFTEISERVGYNTSSYFSSAFKQFTGMTPTQFRKTGKKTEGTE